MNGPIASVNTSGSTHLYINGEDVTISAYSGPLTISTPASSMTFGKDIVYNQQEFDGAMDEIFILNRELDASEVLNYYQALEVLDMFKLNNLSNTK